MQGFGTSEWAKEQSFYSGGVEYGSDFHVTATTMDRGLLGYRGKGNRKFLIGTSIQPWSHLPVLPAEVARAGKGRGCRA